MIWKKILLAALSIVMIFFTEASAEENILEADGYYFVSEGEGDFSLAKDKSLERALQEAGQMASIHIRAVSSMSDQVISDDEILGIAMNVMHLIGEPRYRITYEDEEICYQCHVTVSIDTDEVEEYLREEENKDSESEEEDS